MDKICINIVESYGFKNIIVSPYYEDDSYKEIVKNEYYFIQKKTKTHDLLFNDIKLYTIESNIYKFIVTPDNIVEIINKYDILKQGIGIIIEKIKKFDYSFGHVGDFLKKLKEVYPEKFI